MQADDIQATLGDRSGHALKMVLGRLLAVEMAEAVDGVECGVDLATHAKVRHVADDGRLGESTTSQPRVAIGNGLFIEVIARDLVSYPGELSDQPARSACRLEQTLDDAVGMSLETPFQKIEFGFPIRSEKQIIVLGVVVKVRVENFHEISERE